MKSKREGEVVMEMRILTMLTQSPTVGRESVSLPSSFRTSCQLMKSVE